MFLCNLYLSITLLINFSNDFCILFVTIFLPSYFVYCKKNKETNFIKIIYVAKFLALSEIIILYKSSILTNMCM